MLDFGTFNSFSLTDLRGIKQNKELIIKHTTETNKWGFLNVLLLLLIAIKQYAQNRQKHIIILQRDSFWHESCCEMYNYVCTRTSLCNLSYYMLMAHFIQISHKIMFLQARSEPSCLWHACHMQNLCKKN